MSASGKSAPAVTLYRDVIHFVVPGEAIGDIFYFPYGATVFWGLNLERCSFLS